MSSQSSPGLACVQRTIELLKDSAEGRFKLDIRESSVVIEPIGPDTFPISVYDEGEEAMIAAARWHAHYDDPNQMAFCALWLLTPFYRIVQELKRGVLVALWIESYEKDGWEGYEPVYYLDPNVAESWVLEPGERVTRRITQQHVIDSPKPYHEIVPGAVLDDCGLPPDFRAGTWNMEADELIGVTLSE